MRKSLRKPADKTEDAAYLAHLRRARLEVLVIARRGVRRRSLREAVDEVIADRVQPLIVRAVRRHARYPEGEEEDVVAQATERFWSAIAGESFFDVRFNKAMKSLARNAGRTIRGGRQRELEREGLLGLPGIDYPEPPDPTDMSEKWPLFMDADAALEALPRNQRALLWIRYWFGLPISSRNPCEETMAGMLYESERRLHYRLREAERAFTRMVEDGVPDNDLHQRPGAGRNDRQGAP